ncbi:MAG: asparagine synthase (glutamine-hydrolyzing) [Magnetococcales bacterium]|nr:asparagine synthase (glutamine-hydrolyzing) [Magnetococcales bacterium]
MCGIFGLIATPWQEDAASALATLDSRGPDAHDLLHLGPVTLGHTRLSVIDLAGGRQPMRSPSGHLTLVFNGEIYNFPTLRQELEQLGHRFTTRSDTEVLLVGYQAWGDSLPRRLDGMFAFAVWHEPEQTLFAARDRFGIKPFLYAHGQGFAFASTLAPFLALRGFPRRLNGAALRDFLAFQTPCTPHTFLADVQQLPPAHQLRYQAREQKISLERYWSIPHPSPHPPPPREEIVTRVDAALRESVQRQRLADVPLGAFLSGGIDSSLLVHYLAETTTRPIQTFSMRFAEEEFDETPQARAVAQQFGCEHHELDAPHIDGRTLLAALHDLDQPLADPSYVMVHALARLTRQQVTVAISGDGGDELFGGYGRFFQTEADFPERFGQAGLRYLVERGWLPGALLRRTLHGRDLLFYRRVELGPWPVSRKSMARYLTPEALPLCQVPKTLELWHALLAEFGGRMDTAALMRADLWTYLSENCLVKTDRASMAHGLEVRVPMLGNPVVDAVLSLPATVHGDTSTNKKAILKEIARRTLPETVWNRPKHGFSVPLPSLLPGTWRGAGEDLFTENKIKTLAPFLHAPAVAGLWQNLQAGKRVAHRLVYTFLVLLAWLERHPMQDLVQPTESFPGRDKSDTP